MPLRTTENGNVQTGTNVIEQSFILADFRGFFHLLSPTQLPPAHGVPACTQNDAIYAKSYVIKKKSLLNQLD